MSTSMTSNSLAFPLRGCSQLQILGTSRRVPNQNPRAGLRRRFTASTTLHQSKQRMPPRIFLTGATGYIGGSVFSSLVRRYPQYEISVLLRKPPANFSSQFPNVKLILGDFDSFETISNAAAEADVAIHNGDGDHENALRAMIEGLTRRDGPSYLIKLSGTGIFYDYPDTKDHLGRYDAKVYSDVENIDEITSRPFHALHRHTDAIVQDAAVKYGGKLRTAIVCPPDIYGRGSGPGRKMTYYIPWYVEGIRQLDAAFYLNEGSNIRGWVHINDFTEIYLSLVEAALAGGGSVTWGKQGYFLAATQEYSQKEIAGTVAKILHAKKLVPRADAKSISEREMTALWPKDPNTGLFSFGCNSRTRADRAKKELGFVPQAPTLWDTIEQDLIDAFAKR